MTPEARGAPDPPDPPDQPLGLLARQWEMRGIYRELAGHRVFLVDVSPAGGRAEAEPLLVLHGFPTSSFDFHKVVDRLAASRRVLLCDMVGFGLSAKPDMAFTIDIQADVVTALVASAGLNRLAMLTHDMGDTVGGELLARQEEGRWPVEVTRRILTNGSIYISMARLTPGQDLLLSLPDARLEPVLGEPGGHAMKAALAATFSPTSEVGPEELDACWEMIARERGDLLLARLIRYVEERRRAEARFTGAIERHPSPLTVVWGAEDPVAVVAMVDRLRRARSDAQVVVLDGVGHYPMLEAPVRFVEAVTAGLGAGEP